MGGKSLLVHYWIDVLQHRPPIDPSSLARWSGRIGEEGVERLMTQPIPAGQKSDVISEDSLKRVAVETTMMKRTSPIRRTPDFTSGCVT